MKIEKMTPEEAQEVLRRVEYWHYPFKLPWGTARATKPGHDERHWLRRRHFLQPLLDAYGGSLRDKRVLDLGCCQGFWCFEAARAGADYCLGIDSSAAFILEAKALAVIYNAEGCEFRRAHLEQDAWWSDSQPSHITLFLGLFYHLTDPIFVLRKAINITLETLIVDTEIVQAEDPVLKIAPRDEREPTTRRSSIGSAIRVVPSRSALHELVRDGGFNRISFLTPAPEMPPEYEAGLRISLIARR